MAEGDRYFKDKKKTKIGSLKFDEDDYVIDCSPKTKQKPQYTPKTISSNYFVSFTNDYGIIRKVDSDCKLSLLNDANFLNHTTILKTPKFDRSRYLVFDLENREGKLIGNERFYKYRREETIEEFAKFLFDSQIKYIKQNIPRFVIFHSFQIILTNHALLRARERRVVWSDVTTIIGQNILRVKTVFKNLHALKTEVCVKFENELVGTVIVSITKDKPKSLLVITLWSRNCPIRDQDIETKNLDVNYTFLI